MERGELHLEIIKTESRFGGISEGCYDPTDAPAVDLHSGKDGYVMYRQTPDGIETVFVEGSSSADIPKPDTEVEG